LETSLRKPYGFLNAYTGYFLHVGTTENEINELGTDAETLSPPERRIRRLRHEESKWDPEYYMYVPKSETKKVFLTKDITNHVESFLDHHLSIRPYLFYQVRLRR
jgi:hypothetical protein